MEDSCLIIKDDDANEEWSSFCSSCKSILQSIYSVGVSFLSNETIDELIDKNNINAQVEQNVNLTGPQEKSNCITKNILDYHSRILKIIKSLLYLSTCIDTMREIILQEIRKKQSVLKD